MSDHDPVLGPLAKVHGTQDTVLRMFVRALPNLDVALYKLAEQLRLMRAAREAVDRLGAQHLLGSTQHALTQPRIDKLLSMWTPDNTVQLAQETRELYVPLANGIGMDSLAVELDNLSFAILRPNSYAQVRTVIANTEQERDSYIRGLGHQLTAELSTSNLSAYVSGYALSFSNILGRSKHDDSAVLSGIFDRYNLCILVDAIADCYIALSHVHALWKPEDWSIKDFIANPQPDGYEALHSTAICSEDWPSDVRTLVDVQIRTYQMQRQLDNGDTLMRSAYSDEDISSLQGEQRKTFARELFPWKKALRTGEYRATYGLLTAPVRHSIELGKGQIFVFTPAGDVKELPVRATPLDFAYLIGVDLGNHVAGVRISTMDSNGRLVKKLVPLDYELKNGDVVEIIKRKDAHPTHDWLHVVRTKSARDRIQAYLTAIERDSDLQLGRERLDRDLRTIGLRKGIEELSDEVLEWLAGEFQQDDPGGLLAAIGGDKIRVSIVLTKVRERLFPTSIIDKTANGTLAEITTHEQKIEREVAGLSGLLSHLASCCNPLPTDELMGYITRGRGVTVHRADCANLAHLLAKERQRAIAVDGSAQLAPQLHFRAPIVIEAHDRTGLLADVTGVITGMKIDMSKVTTVTRANRATITATLEIERPDQLSAVLKLLREVPSVQSAERKRSGQKD